MKTIILARHAPTRHNAGHVISGKIDTPLSEAGRRFAAEFVAANGPITADRFVSSPLSRALETARILFKLEEARIEVDPGCVERDYGSMEGRTAEQIATMGIEYIEVGGIEHSVLPPGGESFDALRARAERFIEGLTAGEASVTACVSHQTFLQQAYGVLLGRDTLSSLAFDIKPLQITQFTLEPDGVVEAEELFAGARHIESW